MLNDIGENVMIKTKVVKRRKHSMNLYEKNIKDLREIVNELYSHVSSVGAYSNLATEIERSCSNLPQAIDEYEKMIKEKDLL